MIGGDVHDSSLNFAATGFFRHQSQSHLRSRRSLSICNETWSWSLRITSMGSVIQDNVVSNDLPCWFGDGSPRFCWVPKQQSKRLKLQGSDHLKLTKLSQEDLYSRSEPHDITMDAPFSWIKLVWLTFMISNRYQYSTTTSWCNFRHLGNWPRSS